ncbi:hypothetical protein TorRG33x02_237430, partial [Trema orientale]
MIPVIQISLDNSPIPSLILSSQSSTHPSIDNHLPELDPLLRFCLGANPSPHSPNRGPIRYHSSWKKRARSVSVHIPDRPSPADLGLLPKNHVESPEKVFTTSIAESNSL